MVMVEIGMLRSVVVKEGSKTFFKAGIVFFIVIRSSFPSSLTRISFLKCSRSSLNVITAESWVSESIEERFEFFEDDSKVFFDLVSL